MKPGGWVSFFLMDIIYVACSAPTNTKLRSMWCILLIRRGFVSNKRRIIDEYALIDGRERWEARGSVVMSLCIDELVEAERFGLFRVRCVRCTLPKTDSGL